MMSGWDFIISQNFMKISVNLLKIIDGHKQLAVKKIETYQPI